MVSIIVAISQNNIIGKNNKLPWSIKEDLKLFKKITKGNIVIMGRKTYESIGKPLEERYNIVITSQGNYENVIIARNFNEALEIAKKYNKEIFIIGGVSLYEKALKIADTLFISHIKKEVEGDTEFPNYDKNEWEIEEEKDYEEFLWRKYKRV